MRKSRIILLLFVLAMTIGCSNANKESLINDAYISAEDTKDSSQAVEKILTEDLSDYFTGYEGCFVLYDNKKGEYSIYNRNKSIKQVPPCSTFKIVNSLIGLEANVLQDGNTVIKWDGTRYAIEEWNKDHSLSSAISNSVVWYYQQVASTVGEERMQSWLDKINYGNKDISGGITKFWLQSSLKISPREQVDMLKQMYAYKLPFSQKNVDIVKKIIILSDEDGIVLSGKTGSGVKENKGINGWFVGYVERDGNVFFFAANIEAEDGAAGVKAKEIAMRILKDKSIIQ
ncbi:MAG: class D beta-lactamase [Clostridia bacterium BRH_c25]|nr:MAG: class D beta-lactamase [Clostridia bacterium BRH_c25]